MSRISPFLSSVTATILVQSSTRSIITPYLVYLLVPLLPVVYFPHKIIVLKYKTHCTPLLLKILQWLLISFILKFTDLQKPTWTGFPIFLTSFPILSLSHSFATPFASLFFLKYTKDYFFAKLFSLLPMLFPQIFYDILRHFLWVLAQMAPSFSDHLLQIAASQLLAPFFFLLFSVARIPNGYVYLFISLYSDCLGHKTHKS